MGEPLPPKLIQCLKEFSFVELHWSLPAPLMRPSLSQEDCSGSPCHCLAMALAKRSRKTVDDIFTWLLCFHRFTAAPCVFHPHMLPQLSAHANTILQAHLQFQGDGWRIYDRAFRIQAASNRCTNLKGVDPSLYAHFVASQGRRTAVCQFCCSSSHRSSSCPWGVDEPPSSRAPLPDLAHGHPGSVQHRITYSSNLPLLEWGLLQVPRCL